MKVYAVYSIPKSPEYKFELAFLTKEEAKEYVKEQKKLTPECIYDVQIEEDEYESLRVEEDEYD